MIRSDISVDWAASPRIVVVTSSADNISIQDFYDTLRNIAAKEEAIDEDEIVDAGGKEGGLVAVTMMLYNALIKFKNTGIPRTCRVSGGNLFAVDVNGNDMFPIAYNDNVTVGYAQSTSASLIQGSGGATPAEIWAHGTRTLTSFGSLVADMWSHTARTLTSFGALIASIWNYVGRTLSSGTKDAEIDSLLAKVSGMEAVDFGNWKIQGHQMIFYKGQDSEELMRFNLYDKSGNLTEDMLKVFERRRA